MYFDGLYLKDFSSLTTEFCVRYLDLSKIIVDHVMYQGWSFLWCMCGYLDVNEFVSEGFPFTRSCVPSMLYVACHRSVCGKYLNCHDYLAPF